MFDGLGGKISRVGLPPLGSLASLHAGQVRPISVAVVSVPPGKPLLPSIAGDVNLTKARPLDVPFDLAPPPFDAAPTPFLKRDILQASSLQGWLQAVQATHRVGLGTTLDELAATVRPPRDARGGPRPPVSFEQAVLKFRATPRQTLAVAQEARGLGREESTLALAYMAGERATDRPTMIAAAKLAHRLGGRTEAEHILFRGAQRARTGEDALATARRALHMGYLDGAKHAYFRAAELAATAPEALAIAAEATSQGLTYDMDEDAFYRWRERLDQRFTHMEKQAGVADPGRDSPYRLVGLTRARYINPYMAAMLKAERPALAPIARAAAAAGESRTADLIVARMAADTRPATGRLP